jgi:hypothetical protein
VGAHLRRAGSSHPILREQLLPMTVAVPHFIKEAVRRLFRAKFLGALLIHCILALMLIKLFMELICPGMLLLIIFS